MGYDDFYDQGTDAGYWYASGMYDTAAGLKRVWAGINLHAENVGPAADQSFIDESVDMDPYRDSTGRTTLLVRSAPSIIDTSNDSFIDTSTSLEWMDFGINDNQSYNYVVSQLGSGGVYEEWRLPTREEVLTLWANAYLGLAADYENADHYGLGELRVVEDGGINYNPVMQPVFFIMGYDDFYVQGTDAGYWYSSGMYDTATGLKRVWAGINLHGENVGPAADQSFIDESVNMDPYKDSTGRTTLLVK